MRTLAVRTSRTSCRTPYETTPAAWRLALQKVWNWGSKTNGTQNTATVAANALTSKSLQALKSKLSSTAPQSITVVGHSFTMEKHWSSPTAFVPLAKEVLRLVDAPVTITQITAGGMDALWAKNEFLPKALATDGQSIYFVVTATQPKEWQALADMITSVKKSGRKAYVFDAIDLYDPYQHREDVARSAVTAARNAGAEVIEVQKTFDRVHAGLRKRFLCLDGVHMTEQYHRFMANEWMGYLAGARTAKDSGPYFAEDKLLYEVDVAKVQLSARTNGSAWATVYKDALAQGATDRATDIAELYTRASYLPAPGLTTVDEVDDLLEAYGYTALGTEIVLTDN